MTTELHDVLIDEIRENRREIAKVKEMVWASRFKTEAKIVAVATTLSVLISIGAIKWVMT